MPIVVMIPEELKAGVAKGHCCKQVLKNVNQSKLIVMDQEKDGAGVQGELFKRRHSEIPDAERVQILQEKLYQKAKQERGYIFYVLYDKMFIPLCYGRRGNQSKPMEVLLELTG